MKYGTNGIYGIAFTIENCYNVDVEGGEKMIRAAICDDELLMLEQMHSIVQSTFLDNQLPCELSSFQSGIKLLVAHHQQPFDIIFLDILMPDCNGFDVAKEIRAISDKTLLLFVTSQDELVYDSFHYHPFYFLRKGDGSTFAESLSETVRKIVDFIKRNRVIALRLDSGEFRMICLQDILFIASRRNFVDYHLVSGEYIPIREPLNETQAKLDAYGFVRIHKQYVVNMSKIQKIAISKSSEVVLISSKALPIGRKFKQSTAFRYREFMRIIT